MAERSADGLTRHQQHVAAHVIDCELLGLGHVRGEVLLVLDLPFIWAIAADGAMALESDAETADRLDLPEAERTALCHEAAALREGLASSEMLAPLPAGWRVTQVTCEPINATQARTLIACDGGSIAIEPRAERAQAQINR